MKLTGLLLEPGVQTEIVRKIGRSTESSDEDD